MAAKYIHFCKVVPAITTEKLGAVRPGETNVVQLFAIVGFPASLW